MYALISHTRCSTKHHSVGKTILSADDIIRNRERQKKLASMGVKRPAQGPPGGVDVQAQHVAQRAKWEATQQAVYRRSSEEEAQVGFWKKGMMFS